MRSIGTRFSIAVGTFALLFSGIVLYRAWASAKQETEALISAEAKLALEFDLAIRQYVGDTIRPEMEKRVGPDEFVVEAMSTSYVARAIVDKVRKEFPEYLLKFPSDSPHNPKNEAGPEELEVIQYFRDNPEKDRWVGKLKIDGTGYFAHASARRIRESCLRCHGQPEDCPESLLERYPSNSGFYRKVGDVAGMDMIAIPMDVVNASLASHTRTDLLTAAAWLVVLFGSILVAFRLIVYRRLTAITEHFQTAASRETGSVKPIPESGSDEIAFLAHGFNSLASRLQTLHASLEQQVRDRTAELATSNDHLRNEIDNRKNVERALRQEQRLLKRSLRMHDHDRQVIAYEIHDGLAQDLFAAMMTFQSLDLANSQKAREKLEAGIGMLTNCTAEARRLIDGVRPPLLDEQGVVVAIENLLCASSGDDSPEIEFRHSPDIGRLEPVLEDTIYRIVQEGISNARRHSKSERVRVSLEREESWIRLQVEDWGIGFDMSKTQGHNIGLNGIMERARLLGGKAVIQSSPGIGTKVFVELPTRLPDDDPTDTDF